MKDLLLVGGFHEVIELCESCGRKIVGIIDNNLVGEYMGYPILGTDEEASELFNKYSNCELVVTPDSPSLRKKLVEYYSLIGYYFATIISPDARVAKSSIVSDGVVIQAGVNVSSYTKIGKFVKLNTNSNIMHDSVIGDFCTIAPNAVCLGRVYVGAGSYVGANSTILPEIQIGEKSVVGAGAVVTHNVSNCVTVKGIPAK